MDSQYIAPAGDVNKVCKECSSSKLWFRGSWDCTPLEHRGLCDGVRGSELPDVPGNRDRLAKVPRVRMHRTQATRVGTKGEVRLGDGDISEVGRMRRSTIAALLAD